MDNTSIATPLEEKISVDLTTATVMDKHEERERRLSYSQGGVKGLIESKRPVELAVQE
jgi:hypothetical protein